MGSPVIKTRLLPNDISGLQFWIDANDESSITKDGSNRISQADDKSANGYNVVQGAASKQPLWVPNSLNGKAGIQFDPTNAEILISSVNATNCISKDGYTFFCVVKSNVSTLASDQWPFQVRVNLANLSPGLQSQKSVSDRYVARSRDMTEYLLSMDADTIAWQSGSGYTRMTFNGTPNLSGVNVGDIIIITNATNASNNGEYRIQVIDDGADYIEYNNPNRTDATDDEASDSTATADVYSEKSGLLATNTNENIVLDTNPHVMISRHKPISGTGNTFSYREFLYDNVEQVDRDYVSVKYLTTLNIESVSLGGRANDIQYFDGIIYDVAIYNRYLTLYEIGALQSYANKKFGFGY